MIQPRSLALACFWAVTTLLAPVAADGQGTVLWDRAYPNEANVYARVIELQHAGSDNGKLISTWEHWYANNTSNAAFTNGTEGSFVIRESTDNGASWSTLTTIYDEQTATGHPAARFWQPFFFEFPHQIGQYPAGTLLLVANLVDHEKTVTQFVTWRSTDHGHTWTFVGEWQRGGTTTRGIWEPFLYLDAQGALVVAFSDEREWATHSQMLVQVISTDGGDTWGDVQRTVASTSQKDRPGMPTVVRMDNGQYIMAYEICGREPLRCPIHTKISVDGRTWAETDMGRQVVSTDGRYAGSSPYAIWDGAQKQVVIAPHNVWDRVSLARAPEAERALYINKNRGEGNWSWAPAPWAVSYAGEPACNSNYSPHLLLRDNGVIRYTAPTSKDGGGFCMVRTGQAQVGVLPYTSDFAANGQLGWINTGASGAVVWSVVGDEYRVGMVGSGISTLAITGATSWSNYRVTADVKIVGSPGVVGLVGRVTRPGPGLDQFQGYTLAINSATGNLTLSRNTNNQVVLKSQAYPGGIVADRWYTMSLSMGGSQFTATLKAHCNTAELSYTVPDGGHAWGLAGLISKIGGGSFKNVVVEAI